MEVLVKIVVVLILLPAMILVLVGIRRLAGLSTFDDADETDALKEDLECSDEIMSRHNSFHKLVEEIDNYEKSSIQNFQKVTEKVPSSRRL